MISLQMATAYLKAPAAQQPTSASLDTPNLPALTFLPNGLCVAYVVDDGDQLVYVQNRHLTETGTSIQQLHAIGLGNLEKRLRGSLRVEKHGPIYGVFADGNFEASALLIDSLWDSELRELVRTGFICAAPARDVLAFCDERSKEGRSVLEEMIQRLFGSGADHLLSRSLFRRSKNGWEGVS